MGVTILFLVPDETGTDEALALVCLGSGLRVRHLADVLTEPSLHHCQIYCDHSMMKGRRRENVKIVETHTKIKNVDGEGTLGI